MRLFFVIGLLFSVLLHSKETVTLTLNANGTQTVRIPLNYETANVTQSSLRGGRAEHVFNFPIPARWLVLSAKAKLHYTPSLAIIPERSVIALSFNDKTVVQKWINATDRGLDTTLEASLPAESFSNYNRLTINGYQHYTIDHCEDETAPELWTKIDTKKSYIELTILPKILPPQLSSIDYYCLDPKNISRQKIAFVLPSKKGKNVATGAVIAASAIGKKLKYRDVEFDLFAKIPTDTDTVVIATRNELTKIIASSFPETSKTLLPRLSNHTIVFLSNPSNPQYGIIAITGNSDEELLRNAQAFASYDFTLFKSAGVRVDKLALPEESQPYTAPRYLPTGQRITFRELGGKTTTFKYMYPSAMNLHFKMYPDLYFDDKQKITINVEGIYPSKVRHDSVLNVSVNDKFAAQFPFDEKTAREMSVTKLFNFKKSDTFPAYLIGNGNNKLSLQPAMVPFKKGFCELYNMENLQTTLLDTSFIELPDAPHWLEMPYIRYFLYAAYPFSIHPDGLSTALVLDSYSSSNLKAALKIGFFLGREIEYPLYRVTVTTSPDEAKDKEIVYIGAYGSPHAELFDNAQVKTEGNRFAASFPSVYKFIDHLPFFDADRLDPYRYAKTLEESADTAKKMLVQVFRSPYDSSRSVIALQYDSPASLEQGINLLFSPQEEIGWNSDTLIVDTELERISSFEIGDKYFVGTLSLFDRIRFYVTESPLMFGFWTIFLLLVMAYAIRRLLHHFKQQHHPHV